METQVPFEMDPISVLARIKPPKENQPSILTVEENNLRLKAPTTTQKSNGSDKISHEFCFDTVFLPTATQEQVYQGLEPNVRSLDKPNVAIFTYGQSGTGKTHTMIGDPKNPGILYRMIHEVPQVNNSVATVTVAEIYKNRVIDLIGAVAVAKRGKSLVPQKSTTIRIIDGKLLGPSSLYTQAKSPEEIVELVQSAIEFRSTNATNLNESSSRSHLIIIISIGSKKITFVDLAGIESARYSNAKDAGEVSFINTSLCALGRVLTQLQHKSKSTHALLPLNQPQNEIYVPYQDSLLTKLLKNSLEQSKVTFFVCLSPLAKYYSSTLSVLEYASKIRKIKRTTIAQSTNSNELKRLEDADSLRNKPKKSESTKLSMETDLMDEIMEKEKKIKELENLLRRSFELSRGLVQENTVLKEEIGRLTLNLSFAELMSDAKSTLEEELSSGVEEKSD